MLPSNPFWLSSSFCRSPPNMSLGSYHDESNPSKVGRKTYILCGALL